MHQFPVQIHKLSLTRRMPALSRTAVIQLGFECRPAANGCFEPEAVDRFTLPRDKIARRFGLRCGCNSTRAIFPKTGHSLHAVRPKS